MSTIFRFFILFALSSENFCYNIRDDASWFKDRFLNGMIQGRNTICTVRNELEVEGVCLPQRECNNVGGTRKGPCSFLGSCCVIEKTCSQTSSSKLSYFVSPGTVQSDCRLTVTPINRDVCQIRLDFEKFSIGQPTQPSGLDSSFQCLHDKFTVSTTGGYLGFEHLCGENTNQHIYIPVNNQNDIVLRFQLNSNRNGLDFLPEKPEWRIKIHQLECSRSQSTDINNVQSYLQTLHLSHASSSQNSQHDLLGHHHKPSQNLDHLLIAPTGCLQYYPERSGTYESFNYNNILRNYIGNMKYAICFRRMPDTCGISHTADFFILNYNENSDSGKDIICHTGNPSSEEVSNDSLQIPGGKINNQESEFYCGEQLNNAVAVKSTMPGPFHVIVRTDKFRSNGKLELGFRINYELLSGECLWDTD